MHPEDEHYVPAPGQIYSPEFLADPHGVCARVRATDPVHLEVMPNDTKIWILTRYDHARTALADPRLLRSMAQPDEGAFHRHIGNSDPPEHTRLRKLASKAVTPRRTEQVRDRVRAHADRLLDAVAGQSTVDLMPAYAHPVAMFAVAELLGVSTPDLELFRWCWDTLAGFHSPEQLPEFNKALATLRAYFTREFDRRRREPTDDVLTALLLARVGEDGLDEEELVSMAVFLVIGGSKTTSGMLGNGVLALLTHPEQWALLRDDPGLLPGAVEELLRFDSPVMLTQPARAGEPMDIGDVHVSPGDLVQGALASANRDPARFPDPDRLDVCRPVGGHLAFSHGKHFCLGAPLSRMTGEVAIGRLVTRFPQLRLDPDASPSWTPDHIVRRLAALPVLPGPHVDPPTT